MTATEIYREETRERAGLISAESYEIWLDLTRGPETFRSTSVIRFGCARPGAASYVDLIAERVHEIVLNGCRVDPGTAVSPGRIELRDLAQANELRVTAECRYSRDGTGLHRSVDSADGKVYIYTKFEPAYARRMFANFEQPDLKSRFTFHVTVPAHWAVLSNQPALDGQPEPAPAPGGESAVTWNFPPTPVISTYLTAVMAGDYHVLAGSHTTARGQRVPLVLACRASLVASLDAEDILRITRTGLDFYTGLFEADYPFGQYGQVFVPEYSAGATENVGCVALSDDLLFPSKVTDAMYELRAMIVLHEMAHMWFGDLVTMRWWDDLWLNESFAELCATISSSEATRFTDAWTTFSIVRKTWAYEQDRLPSAHPVAADVPTLSQAVANFDGISYAKGASVLRQLVTLLGRDEFFAGIRAYFAEHAFGNATLADLLRALEASSGRPLGDWARAWLQTAGPNTLRAEYQAGADGVITSFAVTQTAPELYPTLRPHHHVAIGLYDRDGAGRLARRLQVTADIEGPRTQIAELAGHRAADLIVVNDGDLGYLSTRFDPRSLATLSESIGGLADPLTRAVCWTALLDMARQAELSLPAFIRVVVAGMGAETSMSALQALHSVTGQLMTTGDPAEVTEGKAQLAAEGGRLLRAAAPGSDHQLAWAQLLSWTATTPDQLDLITALLDDSGHGVAGLVVDAGLRWALLRRLCAAGRAGDERIAAELVRDPTDGGRRHAMSCRAAIPDAAHKQAAWALLTETSELGVQGVSEVAQGFALPEHASLLGGYAERYFEVLPGLWDSRGEHFRNMLAQALFPAVNPGPALLDRVDEFLAAADRGPGLVRVLTDRRAVIELALRSRDLPA